MAYHQRDMTAVLAPPPSIPAPAAPARTRPAITPQARPDPVPRPSPAPLVRTPHDRFLFQGVDWDFYTRVDDQVGPGVRVTYYKGTLELVTLSMLHDATSSVIAVLVSVLAEEAGLPKRNIGSATLRAQPLGVGTQGDLVYYFGPNVARVRPRVESGALFDPAVDPPPDLAVEVEVTNRLGSRLDIYREIGVPEVWRYHGALTVLELRDGRYEPADRSPTFPLLSPQEIAGFVATGVQVDETTLAVQFRRRVREAMGR